MVMVMVFGSGFNRLWFFRPWFMLFWFRLGWTAGLMVLKWFKVDGNWFVVYVDSRLRVLIMVMYGTGFFCGTMQVCMV